MPPPVLWHAAMIDATQHWPHWVAFDAEPTAQRIVLVVDVPHPDLRETTNR